VKIKVTYEVKYMKFTAKDCYEIIGTDITFRTLNAAENKCAIIPINLMWYT